MSVISSLLVSLALNSMPGATPAEVPEAARDAKSLFVTVDASDKTNFVFFSYADGELKASSAESSWMFGVRRYIFKTATGVNGPSVGGAYVGAGSDYASLRSCSNLAFEADQTVTMLGYTIDANALMTSEWFDYNESGAVQPMDKFFVIARDSDCIKLKITSYDAGVYGIEYQPLTFGSDGIAAPIP